MSESVLSYQLYRWAKYFIYAMLSLNIWFFLAEELASAQFALEADDTAVMGIQLFSATLDTIAWVILLLLFEAETAVIPDHRLKGLLRLAIHVVRMLCTLAICLAFLGYIAEWRTLLASMPVTQSACSLVSDNWVVMLKLDEFIPLTAGNCAQWGSDTRVVSGLEHVLAAPSGLLAAQRLALVDVINAGAWIAWCLVGLRLFEEPGADPRPTEVSVVDLFGELPVALACRLAGKPVGRTSALPPLT